MITALVLAAGRSVRMGAQKLLLPLGTKTVIAHVIDAIWAGEVNRVIVVVGQDGTGIRQALKDRPVTFAVNPDPDGDMLSSVRCGLCAAPEDCEAILVALGDHPSVKTAWIQQMILSLQEGRGGIVVPVHQGKRGHPILFSARFRAEVMSRYDELGLRGLVQAHREEVSSIEVGSPDVLEDLDTPQDYERQRSKFEGI